MTSLRARPNSIAGRLFASVLLLGLASLILLFRQEIIDQYRVWNYQPSSEVASYVDRTTMTDRGRFLFYASAPLLLDREPFNDACRSVATEQTAVLGCYSGEKIYLFNIDNTTLDGIKDVTAAHEMLHAAYERLPTPEKDRVNGLLEQQSLGEDKVRVDALMVEYAKSEPGERLNELHSILGSEVKNLSPELETYYGQYFSNRPELVSLAKKYQSVFDALKLKQEALVAEINALADQIEKDGAVYKRNSQVLNSDVQSFNTRASSGTMSRAEYDAERELLESQQDAIRSEYDALQDLIASYEEKRGELAAINSESVGLNRSINSSVSPVPEIQ